MGLSGGARKSDSGGGESVGHEMGRHIVGLLDKRKADLDDDDYAHMRKVIGYVHRHLKQKPTKESIEDSRWRYSLMNWGHDPPKVTARSLTAPVPAAARDRFTISSVSAHTIASPDLDGK